MQTHVNLIHLVKSFKEYIQAKIGVDTAGNETLKVCHKVVRQ